MSPLTKVFIVLVTIFSVMLVAIVVTFAANQQNLREKYDAQKRLLNTANASAGLLQREIEALQDRSSKIFADKNGEIQNLKAELRNRTEESAASATRAINIQSERDKLDARNSALSSSIDFLTQESQAMGTELSGLRVELDQSREQLILVSDTAAAQATEIEMLKKEARFHKERIAELTDENQQMLAVLEREGIAIGDEKMAPGQTVATFRIDGSIMAVRQDEGGDTYVQVNIGSNDGVEPNMKFVVHDKSHYKGSMVITVVDREKSAGKMTLVEEKIAKGDQVVTGPLQ